MLYILFSIKFGGKCLKIDNYKFCDSFIGESLSSGFFS